jgi:hypothetical protein
VISPVLAFRPAVVKGRLPAGSDACPLSSKDVLRATGTPLAFVTAPDHGVARAALVAAKVLHATVGLTLPPDVAPDRWFAGVVRAADELAAGLPVVLAAEVVVEGEGGPPVDRAAAAVWRLLDAGITHLGFQVDTVAVEERGRVLAELIAPVLERGVGVECVLPLSDDAASARQAVALVAELSGRDTPLDAAGVRCAAPRDVEAARAQVGALTRLAEALGEVSVIRRGPSSPALFPVLVGAPVWGCDDGGAVAAAAGVQEERGDESARWRARAEAALGPAALERLEARAFVATAELVEALRGARSAVALVRALERRLAEDHG